MIEALQAKPFLVAITAGACAQLLKVLSFIALEKKVNYRRFVQTDGAPNMHSAAFSALAAAVGMREGFDSLMFAFAVCVTAIILVDTMNVKNATSRQAEAVLLLLDRVRKKPYPNPDQKRLSYTPMDVFSGVAMGIGIALLVL
jgi:acid phosphatase family membrane protein YuiD